MSSTFQRMLALRYLRMEVPRSMKLHIITAVLFLLTAAAWVGSAWVDHSRSLPVQEFRADFGRALVMAKVSTSLAFVMVWVFLVIVRRMTIFTSISAYGLFLGSAALVVVLSVMAGFEGDLQRKIIGTNAHIVITHEGDTFPEPDVAMKKITATPDVMGVTPFLSSELMISSATNVSGVVLKGVDPQTVGSVTELTRNLVVGQLGYLEHPEKLRALGGTEFEHADKDGDDDDEPKVKREERRTIPGVLLGTELAKTLRVYIGDDINLVCPLCGIGPSGAIAKSKPFRVAGVFQTGMFEYDSKYAYIALGAAQKFLEQSDVTGIEVKVRDPDQSEKVVAALQPQLGAGYDVQDWKWMNRSLFAALKLEKIVMFVALLFIILVAAFSIIATGMMLVMQKGREIAVLKSMGATDKSIMRVFILLGGYIGVFGTSAGIVAGVLACLALGRWGLMDTEVYYMSQLPVKMHASDIAIVFVSSIVIALAATLYPAWKAAQLRPVDGLREGNG